MNQNTRISVHCYEGDAHQVAGLMPVHLSHGCPVSVVSPKDSRAASIPGADMIYAGHREGSTAIGGYGQTISEGQISFDRQHAQMKILLRYPEKFFLMNDSDSFCLSPELPKYLYDEPDVFWSNLVYDPIPHHVHPPGMPRLALQPPYFCSRDILAKLVVAHERAKVCPTMPYIDHYMLQLAVISGVQFKGFPDCFSGDTDRQHMVLEIAQVHVRHLGRIFIHSAKTPETWGPLIQARKEFLEGITDPDTTRNIKPPGQEYVPCPPPPTT